MIQQQEIILPEFKKGFHLISHLIIKELNKMPQTGLLSIFLKHTSAGITLNENADPSVRTDFNTIFEQLIPENKDYYTHTFEGSDDMPAHLKSSLTGVQITIPISNGKLNLGTWQGIYLCEFRNFGGKRKLVLTIYS